MKNNIKQTQMKKSTHAIIHKTPFTWKINDL